MKGPVRIFAGLLAAMLPATPVVGQLRPDGPEITLTAVGENLALDTDAEGRTVVVWSTVVSFLADEIYVQRFGTTGLPIGGPLLLTTQNVPPFWSDFTFMSNLGTALTGNGEFVVAWNAGRQYDAGANLIGSFAGDSDRRLPRLAGRPGGDFVVSWSYGIPGDAEYFRLQSFDLDASPVAPSLDSAFGMGSSWESVQSEVRTNGSGDLLVARLDPYGFMEIRAFDPAGIQRASAQISDALTWGGQHIALAEDGSFVVAWYHNDSPWQLKLQRYSPDAAPLGPVVLMDVIPSPPVALAVAHDGTREFVVIWDHLESSMSTLTAQRFSATGETVGTPFLITTPAGGIPAVAADMDAGGNLTVGWMHSDDGSNPYNIRVRRFCGPLRISAPQSQAVCAGSPVGFDAAATGRAPFSLQWRRDGVPLSDGGGISGTASEALTIDAASVADSGAYDLSVTDSCFTPENSASATAQLDVFDAPQTQAVPDLLVNLDAGDSSLVFNWTDVAGTADYAIYADTAPDGPFTTLTGVAASGEPGLTVPTPDGTVFYLAVARNPCGDGPLR